LFDKRGLFLLVTPTRGKLWRFKYRTGGKEKLISLGGYPDVSLADARDRRDARAAKEDTFEAIAREWFQKFKPQWMEGHWRTVLSRMEDNLFPRRILTRPNCGSSSRPLLGATPRPRAVRQHPPARDRIALRIPGLLRHK
jgi:hypothetical protein